MLSPIISPKRKTAEVMSWVSVVSYVCRLTLVGYLGDSSNLLECSFRHGGIG